MRLSSATLFLGSPSWLSPQRPPRYSKRHTQGVCGETKQENKSQADSSKRDDIMELSTVVFWRSARLHSAVFYWSGRQRADNLPAQQGDAFGNGHAFKTPDERGVACG